MTVLDLLSYLGQWSMEAVWLPTLAWTVIAVPFAVLARMSKRLSPLTRYGITSALLAALPIGLFIAALPTFGAGTLPIAGFIHLPETIVRPAADAAATAAWTAAHSSGLLFVAAMLAAITRLLHLAASAVQLATLRSSLDHVPNADLQKTTNRISNQLGVRTHVSTAVSPHIATPLTFGWRRPIVVLPSELLKAPDDLELTLLHELVHIRRHDYAVQWLEQFIGSIFVIHPLVVILRRHASFLREATCDAEVVERSGRRSAYAHLLFRFASRTRPSWKLAVGISFTERHLKKRLLAMKDFADVRRSKRLGMILALLLFATSSALVACTDQFVDSETAPAEAELSKKANDAYVYVEMMPKLIGGLAAIRQNLVYPETAKRAGVEGRVVISFVVDEDGAVQNAEVLKGVGSGLDEEALRAVRQATFEPGLKDGKPVKVKMAIPVTFKL